MIKKKFMYLAAVALSSVFVLSSEASLTEISVNGLSGPFIKVPINIERPYEALNAIIQEIAQKTGAPYYCIKLFAGPDTQDVLEYKRGVFDSSGNNSGNHVEFIQKAIDSGSNISFIIVTEDDVLDRALREDIEKNGVNPL